MKKKIVVVICSLLIVLLLVALFPYAKAEYLTNKYGDQFREEYKQIDWISDIEYHKVIGYSSDKATVVYIAHNHTACFKIDFEMKEDEWQMTTWDCIWSKTGSADGIMWPYYW